MSKRSNDFNIIVLTHLFLSNQILNLLFWHVTAADVRDVFNCGGEHLIQLTQGNLLRRKIYPGCHTRCRNSARQQ